MTRKPTQINFLTKTHYKFTDDNGVIFNEERKHIKKYAKKAIKPMKTYMLYELKVTLEYSPNEVCVKTFHFNGVKRMSYIIEKLDKLIK
jgi:hypothetical protein